MHAPVKMKRKAAPSFHNPTRVKLDFEATASKGFRSPRESRICEASFVIAKVAILLRAGTMAAGEAERAAPRKKGEDR